MGTNTAALLEAARSGDQAAWDDLVADFNNLVWSIVRGYRLPDGDAADAVQMTWLRLVENLDRIRDAERLPAWLCTTARRESLQVLRRQRRNPTSVVDDTFLTQLPDDVAPVDGGLLLDERDGALWQAFTRLGERCRRLLRILMATPPPSYRDVSEALDMPHGSIGPTRQRCLNDLRAIVQADPELASQLREES